MKIANASEFVRAREAHDAHIGASCPLVVDLDGALFRTSLNLEAACNLIRRQPFALLLMIFWMCRGPAYLKHQIAVRSDLDLALLPTNAALLDYATEAADSGRVVLATSTANLLLADRARARFGFLGDVMSSTERTNLSSRRKAAALKARFPDAYAYAGHDAGDLAVWRGATFALFAGRDPHLLQRVARDTLIEADFTSEPATARDWIRALRVHQWTKNLLVFLPIMLAGHLADARGWAACVLTFVALSITASATYLINDLLDLEADRQHWSKRNRPFASGSLGIAHGALAATILLGVGLTLAMAAGGLPVLGALLLYCAVTLAYSLSLKRIPILDVTVLAALFTMRLGLGAVAADVRLSSWLAVFSMFLFLSLALAKRSTEIARKQASGTAATHGRGYVAADAPLIATLGMSAGLCAVLFMVLYLILEAFEGGLYDAPALLWGVPVLIGLWLGRVWLLCGRGTLNDDPVAFAVTDRVSIVLGVGVVACFGSAALFAPF